MSRGIFAMDAQLTPPHEPKDWSTVEELLRKWRDTIGTIQNAHYQSAIHTERLNLMLGVPVIILTGLVGFSQSLVNPPYRIALGILGLIAAFLASLQTFFNFKDRSEKHRSGGVRLGALLRQIDLTLSLPVESRPDAKEFMHMVRNEWDTLQEDLPMISERVWQKSQKMRKDVAGRD